MAKRPNKLLDKIIATSVARARKDINQWRMALQRAESVENPKRYLLYNIYNELILDAHLSAEVQRRTLAVQGASYNLVNEEGITDPEKTKLIKRPWFNDFLRYAMESVFWGHSLVQINDLVEGEVSGVTLINRNHVIPEKGLFVFRQTDDKGIFYREDEKYWQWLLEIGNTNDLGLYNKCAPHVLYKRFAQGAWSEFCEIFGMPVRYLKTNAKDDESLNRAENMLKTMGSSFYGVLDTDEELKFLETAKSDGGVYKGLMDVSNNEISKLINGAVIGGESQGGSRSKEEVGERLSESITDADKQFIEHYVNHTLIPKLIALGYDLNGVSFQFEKSQDLKQLFTFTQGFMQTMDVDPEWVQDTFGIPVTPKAILPTTQKDAGDFFG